MGKHRAQYTLLVNSTDSFSDCWPLFFRQLEHHWPSLRAPVLLNTETLAPPKSTFEVLSSYSGRGSTRRPTWGESLLVALNRVMTPFVLYVQEDYLLEADVNDDKLTELMRDIEDCNIGHLRLYEVWEEDESVYGNISGFPELLELQGHAIYRTSLQAAVWKTSLLKSLVREKDSGWRFERLGWCRTPAGQERFACLNRHLNNTIFPYTPTGIIRGKWNSRVIETMYRNYGIHIDTTVRGTIAPVKVAYSNTHVRRLIAKAKKLTVRCARANSTIMGAVRILDDLNI